MRLNWFIFIVHKVILMYTHYATVLNVVQAKTKYGIKLALNTKLEDGSQATCWSSELDNPLFLSQKPGNKVRLLKGARGGYTILDDDNVTNGNGHNIQMNRPSSRQEGSYYTHSNNGGNGSNGNGYGNATQTQSYSQRASNAPNTAVNYEEVY